MRYTIGMATYKDYDGVYFTVKTLLIFHSDFLEKLGNQNYEILVVDNAPDSAEGQQIQRFIRNVHKENVIYIPYKDAIGTAPSRQKIIDSARGKYVIVMDSHVILDKGALDYLDKYYEEFPETKDIISGPLVYDDGLNIATHFIPKWRGEMFGTWGSNPRALVKNSSPFEIPGCGLGCFSFRKEAWVGFHPLFRGFGAEELYIHEKFRLNGGKAICLPGFRWHHRFGRPQGVPYPLTRWHKVRNYVLAYKELGWDIEEVRTYFVGGGFFTQKDWDLLMKDPEHNIDPPILLNFADDEKNLKQIQEYLQKENRTDLPKELKDINMTNKENKTDLPKELKDINMTNKENVAEELEKDRLEAERMIKERQGTTNEPKKNNCSSCEKARKEKEKKLMEMRKFKTLKELDDNLNTLAPELKSTIIEFASQANFVFLLDDDPLGCTLTVLNNIKPNTRVMTYFLDPRFGPEAGYLLELSKRENKLFQTGVGPATLIFDAELVIINSPIKIEPLIKRILDDTLPKCTERCLIVGAYKYGEKVTEKEPGISPAVRAFLKENEQWFVKDFSVEGDGFILLSKVQSERPKLPSKITMAKNFVTAIARHVVSGGEVVSQEEAEERLKICMICPYRIENRCSICGCYLVKGPAELGKVKWRSEACPIGKW